MNDFSELESELKKLRPAQPSAEVSARIARVMLEPATTDELPDNVVRLNRFRINWVTVGLGLAAAATFLLLAKIDNQPAKKPNPLAMTSPARIAPAPATSSMVPAGLTEVVYHTRDEGLLYPQGSTQPLRRVRSQRRETLQWRNPQTGASLRVSYPSEEVTLTPISGQ
ncbi:MAG: hypothetical protein QOI04_2163 [Verrucomicrobiota bacterium]|jgi:hypothetical protein